MTTVPFAFKQWKIWQTGLLPAPEDDAPRSANLSWPVCLVGERLLCSHVLLRQPIRLPPSVRVVDYMRVIV